MHHRHLLACCVAALALVIAGCGGSGDDDSSGAKLPAATVKQLDQRLDEIQRRFDTARDEDNQGACDDIASNSFPAISTLIDNLPADTDPKLKDAVSESFANLQQLTDSGCRDVGQTTTQETTPTEPETTPTEPETIPTTPETTPTEPKTTPTTPETTPQTTPQNPGDGGSGAGGGQGGASVPPGGN